MLTWKYWPYFITFDNHIQPEMFRFIQNVGDYFNTGYFTEDFDRKVIDKSGYDAEAIASVVQLNSGKPVFTDDPDVFAEVFINDGITPHGDSPLSVRLC